MSLVMTSGPTSEPVTLAEVKAHLRLDGSHEDVYLASLILTSRLQIESALSLALMTQTWRLTLDDWPPTASLPIPIRPVTAITTLAAITTSGAVEPLDLSRVHLDPGPPPRLLARDGAWPHPTAAYSHIEITLSVGHGSMPSDVPAPIRHALLLLVAHWYEHRDPYETTGPGPSIPGAVSELLMPYRSVRL